MVVGQSKWAKSSPVICIYDITFSSPESGQQALILHPLPLSPSAMVLLNVPYWREGVRLWAFLLFFLGAEEREEGFPAHCSTIIVSFNNLIFQERYILAFHESNPVMR